VLLFDGRAVVADFGIALAVSASGGERLTQTGLSLGTSYYMSPEQAVGDEQIGPASDIYSLGCMLYEMLTGAPPFTGSSPQAILAKIMAGEAPSARAERGSVPAHVEAALRQALQKVPADRFATARGFAAALGDPAFGSADPVEAGREPLPSVASKRLRPSIIAGVGAATLIILAALFDLLPLPWGSGGTGLAVDSKRIAVLPFENLGEDESEQYFVDGMTEQLITELAKVGGLTVISRTSVMRYRQSESSVKQIADELGVETVVEGSVLRAEDRVRINARLTDVSTGGALWAESYDRSITNVLALPAELRGGRCWSRRRSHDPGAELADGAGGGPGKSEIGRAAEGSGRIESGGPTRRRERSESRMACSGAPLTQGGERPGGDYSRVDGVGPAPRFSSPSATSLRG
jgi:TolB-like protein